jgi:hypothetical protein
MSLLNESSQPTVKLKRESIIFTKTDIDKETTTVSQKSMARKRDPQQYDDLPI